MFAAMVLACVAVGGCGGSDEGSPAVSHPAPPREVRIAPVDAGPPGSNLTYVGKDACVQCHAEEAKKWKGSYHDLAMDHASPATVLGDFNDVTFTHFKTTSRFFKRDGKFFVNTEGSEDVGGKPTDYEIKFVFGVYPLQQYLIEFPGGRLQSLAIAWDVPGKKWYHLYPDEAIPHTDELHWTKPLQNWNYMCASCHSTNLRKNYDPDGNLYRTTFAEMNVSCEACHGPGSAHVNWAATRGSGARGGEYFGDDADFKIANYMKGPAHQELETCAPCHARRHVVYPDHHAGSRFADHYGVELLEERLYHADGQILDEVYEYGSFLQSKMFQKGVKCSNCHDPHSTKIVATGNALCVRCHDGAKYDTKGHHFHNTPAASVEKAASTTSDPLAPGSAGERARVRGAGDLLQTVIADPPQTPSPQPSPPADRGRGGRSDAASDPLSPSLLGERARVRGAADLVQSLFPATPVLVDPMQTPSPQPSPPADRGRGGQAAKAHAPITPTCIDCHMPRKNYMVVDPRRDHSFRIPRPDQTVSLGTPNACAACHADKTAEYLRDKVIEWYGPKRPNDPHHAPVFDAARKGKREAEAELIAIAVDEQRPAIVRATALRHLVDYPSPAATQTARKLLRDPDEIVRGAAVRVIDAHEPADQGDLMAALLTDLRRSVRTEAARVMAKVARQRYAANFRRLSAEDAFGPRTQADGGPKEPTDPGALVTEEKAFRAAIEEYRKGQMESADMPGTYLNLAVVHERLGEMAEAEQAYLKAIVRDAKFVPARLNLAMLLARRNAGGDAAAAEKHLRAAITARPDMGEAHYSLGLLLAENPARIQEAADHLGKAAALTKTNARMHYNHGLALQRLGRNVDAEAALRAAYQFDPGADAANALLVLHVQQKQWIRALPYARRLAELFPGDVELRNQAEAIRRRAEDE